MVMVTVVVVVVKLVLVTVPPAYDLDAFMRGVSRHLVNSN